LLKIILQITFFVSLSQIFFALIYTSFIQAIEQISGSRRKKYLLAVSGGVDSMVLAHLFHRSGLQVAWAHCNFKLRGKESDEDQLFVEKAAGSFQVKLHLKICDLNQSGEKNIQLAARNERYQWFDELLQKHSFDYLVTAHHLNDSIETFFINLQRPTGLKGLLGISDRQNTIRPLKNITRDEIIEYAKHHQINWCEDSSNQSDKYLRNYIRRQIIPQFVKRNPEFYQNFKKTFSYLQQSQDLIEDWTREMLQKYIQNKNNLQLFDLQQIKSIKHLDLFLFNWLSPYGFTDWTGVNQLVNSQSGKEIFSKNYRLTKHNNQLILEKIKIDITGKTYIIPGENNEINVPIHLLIKSTDIKNCNEKKYLQASKNEAYLDANKIKFPLIIKNGKQATIFILWE
jgi:tRNA(Ile)-lysidine synthase